MVQHNRVHLWRHMSHAWQPAATLCFISYAWFGQVSQKVNDWNTYFCHSDFGIALLNLWKKGQKMLMTFRQHLQLLFLLIQFIHPIQNIHQGQQWLANMNLPPPPIKQLLWSHRRPFINMPSSLGHQCIKAVASSGMVARSYKNNIIAVPGENSQHRVIVALCRHHGLTTGS